MTQEEFFKRYSYTPSRDRIGGGSFGTVYKAKDNVLHREVAIKVSEVKTSTDGKKTFSLKDEFEALAHVPKHPNIANYEELYSFEMPNGIFDYAVMQYYPDGNLSHAIKEGLTEAQKEDITTQLLEGIAFLHHHKVVHRDLKPGNILIVRDGDKVIPLITDFGLSKAASTGDGSVFSNSFGGGTPRYSSPEQLQGQPLRFNTDLWSFGAVLYEVFTGQQLFSPGSGASNTAQADMEIFNKIVHGDVQSLGKMPEKWRKVAERCLVVDATKRAKDAAELFALIKGEDDETEIGNMGNVGVGASASKRTEQVSSNPGKPSSMSSRGTKPSNGVGGGEPPKTTRDDKPKSKKGLWIGLGIVAAVMMALVLLLKPKQEPTPTDPDTQAYEACQTVADYRAYISDYGGNSLHYTDAKAFVDQYLADSIEQARHAQALADAAQKEEVERQAQAESEKKEEAAYKKCTTIAACDSYLKTYPQGHYVIEVKNKKAALEKEAKTEAEAKDKEEAEKKEADAFKICTTIAACDSYLKTYPQGTYVDSVRKKRDELSKAEAIKTLGSVTGHYNGHDYVDLGLPSGTLWATCNVGANKPDGYGNYFAWGEVTPKELYEWNNYKYACGNHKKLTKYCNKSEYGQNDFTDNLIVLQPADDAASFSWGNGWRLPTIAQWKELMQNTTSEAITQNGVKGKLFVGPNGNSMFLPAAGYYDSGKQCSVSFGYYWSNSICSDYPYRSWGFWFNLYPKGFGVDHESRDYGKFVRAVRSSH